MCAAGIQGAKRRGKPSRTTTPYPDARRRPDLVQRDFTAERPNELWVADFSYLRSWERVVFFSFVIDVYSRKVIGRQFAGHMRTDWSSTRCGWRSPPESEFKGSSGRRSRCAGPRAPVSARSPSSGGSPLTTSRELRRDAATRCGKSSIGRQSAVEGGADRAPSEDREARRQRASLRIRAGATLRPGPPAGRDRRSGPRGGALERVQQADSSGPSVGRAREP
jgi:hypothetical protein